MVINKKYQENNIVNIIEWFSVEHILNMIYNKKSRGLAD